MKNKTNTLSNQAITKQDLKDLRQDISKDFGGVLSDILIQIENRFNKVDIRFKQQDKLINAKFEEQGREFDSKFDNKFTKLKRDLLDSNLQIAEELRLSREERTALNYRQNIHSDQIEENSNEITFLKNNCVLKYN